VAGLIWLTGAISASANRQIDGARETSGFLEPRFGIADDMLIRLRLGIAAARTQNKGR